MRVDVAIVGSGFAGSILARVLRRLGCEVALVERGRHPRFALGESTTPLANLALERLARRYDLPDLFDLSRYGRWLERLPALRRGLKRGFTFYAHRPGEPYRNGPDNDRRLLVAASPEDALADSHWLREDVDHHLVERAVAEGVTYLDRTELASLERSPGGWRLAGRRGDRRVELRAAVVVDGSGADGFLARHLGIASRTAEMRLDTRLVYGHFRGVRPFAEAAATTLPAGPYPEERAAVHHLLEEGWMYVLPFDHGVVSAGLLLERAASGRGVAEPAEPAWHRFLGRYPTLAEQFQEASAVRPVAAIDRVQHRLAAACGKGWALLPHAYAFVDPLFSTGIAWGLLGVERLAACFEAAGGAPDRLAPEGWRAYGRQLAREADHQEGLLAAAYAARSCFEVFRHVAFIYFAAVSFAEVAQRLAGPGAGGEEAARPRAAPYGFLGADDPAIAGLVRELPRRLAAIEGLGSGSAGEADRRAFAEWVERGVASRDLAGLYGVAHRNMVPVDLELLVARAALVGRTPAALRAALPRLRGGR